MFQYHCACYRVPHTYCQYHANEPLLRLIARLNPHYPPYHVQVAEALRDPIIR